MECIVLKTGPDRLVRPVQLGTGSQSGLVKTQNQGWTGNFLKKGLMPGSVFKTMMECTTSQVVHGILDKMSNL